MSIIWLFIMLACWLGFYNRTPSTSTDPSLLTEYSANNLVKHSSREEKRTIPLEAYRDQYMRIEMFVLFFATFVVYFDQTGLETIVAAFTEKNFYWTIVQTSIFLGFCGLEVLIVYVLLVQIFSKRFEDRTLLTFGPISLTLACILGTFFTTGLYSLGWVGLVIQVQVP